MNARVIGPRKALLANRRDVVTFGAERSSCVLRQIRVGLDLHRQVDDTFAREVRGHHHALMTLICFAFLQHERLREKKSAA